MCTRAGRKCPGYSQEFRWSTKHEKALDSAASREPSSFGTLLTAVSKVLTTEPATAAQRPSPGHVPQPPRSLPIQTVAAASAAAAAAAPPPAVFTQLQTPISSCSEADVLSPTSSAAKTLDLSTPSPETYPAEHIELPLQTFQCHSWDTLLADDDAAAPGTVSMYGHNSLQMIATQPVLPPSFQLQFSTSQHVVAEAPDAFMPWIPRSVMDRNSMLVEEWFKHVCTIWSCFDSDLNLNRKIAAGAWARSEPVMRCMQSMAATCLSSQMPQMRRVAIASLKSAIASIKTELRLAGPALARGVFPTDLLLSLCCVGTAACWIDTKQLAARFLREARNIMHRLNRDANAGFLRPEDREALEFFNNSIIYWDMLVAVVSDDDHDTSSGDPDSEGNLLLLRAGYSTDHSGLIIPHPWTGTCAAAQRLFARSIRLCRRFRSHLRGRSISTGAALRAALRYIAEAQGLEEELLGLEQIGVERVAVTGDRLTPREHMVDVGEGYRLASLLQLYQTFPDLVVRRLPEDVSGDGHVVPWDRWVVPLSLRLIGTLRRVPPDSGTRCIQPLLYLSASTGLKFDFHTMAAGLQSQQQQQQQQRQVWQEQAVLPIPLDESVGDPARSQAGVEPPVASVAETEAADIELDQALSSLDAPTDDSEPSAGSGLHDDTNNAQEIDALLQAPLTKMSIEVSHARRFVLERLSALEHSLPPAPVRVARDLVTAVWAAYDAEPPGSNHTHWIDVMEDQDLKTIFG